MIWRKIQNLDLVKLGAINGLIFGSIILSIFLSFCLYLGYLEYLESLNSSSTNFNSVRLLKCSSYDLWFFPLLTLTLVATASLFIKQFVPQLTKFSIFIWQVVGLITSFELYVFGVAHSLLGELKNCEINNYNVFRCENLDIWHYLLPRQENLIILLVILAYNLVFALLLRCLKKDLP